MKNLLLLFALSLSLFSCCKETTEPTRPNPFASRPRPYTGTVTATKNGIPWKGYIYAYRRSDTGKYKNSFTLSLDNYISIDGDSFRKDEIYFDLINPKSYKFVPVSRRLHGIGSNYAADSLESVVFTVSDVDIQLDDLEAVPTDHTFLELQSFNANTSEFGGRFELDFISSKSNKDTIRFRNGVFNGKVYNSFFPK